jgi:hypothetical protein
MFGINLKHSLATVAVAAGLLAAAGSASAGTPQSGVVVDDGHPALAAGIADGTSNTIAFGARAPRPRGFSIDIGTSENIAADGREAALVFSGDAYDNEMGITTSADAIIAVLIGL